MKILSKIKFNKIKTIYNENTILLPHEYFEMYMVNTNHHYFCPRCTSFIFYKVSIEKTLEDKSVLYNITCYICNDIINAYMYLDHVKFKIHKTISI